MEKQFQKSGGPARTIMTTAEKIKNQEKTIQNKLKVLQLMNENTNKIAGSNLLKQIQRHGSLWRAKLINSMK